MVVDALRDVEQFLFYEARLLDERRFEEWLALFTDDCRYWIPTVATRHRGEPEVASRTEMAHFDDTKRTLTLRVKRLLTDFAYAEDPPSRTVRIVSNVTIDDAAMDGELTAYSNLVVYRNRLETTTDLFAGRRTDVLRRAPTGWSIARRTVVLAANVIGANNLSIFF